MKVAFHFNADDERFGGYYGEPIENEFFKQLLSHRSLNVSTKVFVGDLLLHFAALEYEETGKGMTGTFSREKYLEVFKMWLMPESVIWVRFRPERVESCIGGNIFVVCLESIDLQTAEYLNSRLERLPYYFGALEVDDASRVHWSLYSGSLVARYRVINRKISVFWDGFNEDDVDQFVKERLLGLGFKSASHESLNGKFSIFDKYHNFEHARRVAEWKRRCGSLLAFVADDVVSRLSDAAPELSGKLWAALNTFEAAETGEQFAQVAVSCRRVIEFVSDSLFPPSPEKHKGYSLGKKDFRNRLLAFADKERASETNIDLICTSTAALAEQLEKLSALSNKGIHGEVFRSETRRCLLRTILLLDDIISLKPSSFEISSHIDVEEMLSFLNLDEE